MQVICTSKHPVRAKFLGGVLFFDSPVGRISEDLSDEKAAEFLVTPEHFKPHFGEPIPAPAALLAQKVAPAAPKAGGQASDPTF